MNVANAVTMSKNFELMQQLLGEVEQDAPEPLRRSTVVFPAPAAESAASHSRQTFDSIARGECLKLVQRIFLGEPSKPVRVIVFAGIDRGNGCSMISAEAARALASNTSRSVCLVDGNFRTPSLASLFGIADSTGLTDSLDGQATIRNLAQQLTPSNLWLLPAGRHASQAVTPLNSDRLKGCLQELREQFDYILIDGPALNAYSDAIALGRSADGLVIVLQADSTRRESALKGVESLREARVEVLGAVLNRRTFPIPEFVYRRL